MTYVTEQTSDELRVHMRRLQAMPGWCNPLDDRLWKEVQMLEAERDTLQAEVERLRKDGERLDHIQKHARCDPKMDGQHVWWPTNFKHALTGNTLRDAIDRAIEAAKEAGTRAAAAMGGE